jgi:hypothetical protein
VHTVASQALLSAQTAVHLPVPHETPPFVHALEPRHSPMQSELGPHLMPPAAQALDPMQWASQRPAPHVTPKLVHALLPLQMTLQLPVAGHSTAPVSHELPSQSISHDEACVQSTPPPHSPPLRLGQVMRQRYPAGHVALSSAP